MKNFIKNKKFPAVIIILLLLSLSISVLAANDRPLEVEYPGTQGTSPPTTVSTTMPEYAKYVFTFAIVISGIIALGSLILGGFQYITSAGNTTKMKEAKDQILSAFWGIIILLGSYVILNIINPNITSFSTPSLTLFENKELPKTPSYAEKTKDLLSRVKELAENLQQIPDVIKNTGTAIQTLTSQCDCQNTKPICVCEKSSGQSMIKQLASAKKISAEAYISSHIIAQLTQGTNPNLTCMPKTCYAGESSHPCPGKDELKQKGKDLIDQRDVLLYYKERAISEANDLKLDVAMVINPKIDWYNKAIEIEQKNSQEYEGQSGTNQAILSFLNERKGWLEEERNYKLQLAGLLISLGNPIDQVPTPATKITQLAEKCFTNVSDKCKASCKQSSDNGCHDRAKGCEPDKCSGGNPCPTSEIQQEAAKLSSVPQTIKSICSQIISVVDSIPKQRQTNPIF